MFSLQMISSCRDTWAHKVIKTHCISSHDNTTHHNTSHHITTHHNTTHHITSHHNTSRLISLHHTTSTLHRIRPQFITPHSTTPHRSTSHDTSTPLHPMKLHCMRSVYHYLNLCSLSVNTTYSNNECHVQESLRVVRSVLYIFKCYVFVCRSNRGQVCYELFYLDQIRNEYQ